MLAVLFFALSSFAQTGVGTGVTAGKYSITSIPLPANLVLAGATGTNLVGGWTNTVYTTNTSIVWTNSGGSGFNGTFVTNTVITTNNTVTYANFTSLANQNTTVQIEGTNANTPVILLGIAKSTTGVNYDLADILWVTASGSQCFNTNVNMAGFGYGRIVQMTNSATATNIYTNSAAYYSTKANSP